MLKLKSYRQIGQVSKYRNKRVEYDGHKFDSMREMKRYQELRLMEKAGLIRDLKLQPKYPIVVNSVKVCNYVGDFEYYESGRMIPTTEDVKGAKTRVYRLKFKLFRACYGREIRET